MYKDRLQRILNLFVTVVRSLGSRVATVKYVFVLLSILVLSQIVYGNSAYINEIPDFTQTDIRGKDSGNGQQYCAPVAVSNSLMWLSKKSAGQLQLIKKLASKKYMNTSLINGTGVTGVLNGVNKIAVEIFGRYSKLEYQGWRKHPEKYSRGVKIPEIGWLAKGISRKSAVWLNVGWYRFSKKENEYKRIGGHWVTLVGIKNNILIIHDPALMAGRLFSNEFVQITKVLDGTLRGDKAGLPTPAKGYFILGKGMHVKPKADVAILDGAIFFGL